MGDDMQRCVGAVGGCPPWPGQRHPWVDLDPLGRDRRRPLLDLTPVSRVLEPAFGLAESHVRGVLPDVADDWQLRVASTDLGRALGMDRCPVRIDTAEVAG